MAQPFRIPNVERICYFRDDYTQQHVQTFAEFALEFGFEPHGTNEYYGILAENSAHFHATGKALSPTHIAAFDRALYRLNDPDYSETSKTLNFVIEPSQVADPAKGIPGDYEFVRDSSGLIAALADEIKAQQARAKPGRSLQVVVGYASEMNSADSGYGPPTSGDKKQQVASYVETYQYIRDIFRVRAPDVLFAFSPALRADRTLPDILDYWPGNKEVDIVGGTWYIHGAGQMVSSVQLFHDYCNYFGRYGKPMALLEMGGADGTQTPPVYNHNDVFVQQMCEIIANCKASFDYVTLFLDRQRWGNDISTKFMEITV